MNTSIFHLLVNIGRVCCLFKSVNATLTKVNVTLEISMRLREQADNENYGMQYDINVIILQMF